MRIRTAHLVAMPFALLLGALAAKGASADGYKGISWGATCSQAVQQMEAKGFVFAHKEQLGLRGEASSPAQPSLFARADPARPSCSMKDSDLELDTHQPNPYVEVRADSGDIAITLLCRNDRFVGARLETAASNTSAVAMLLEAAGPPAQTLRADTCGPGLKCTADHAVLRQRGDAVRYLERPLRASRDYDGQQAPLVRYLILDRAEDRALQSASVACANKKLASDVTEKKRIHNGNQAAVE